VIASNASPLIVLLKINKLSILKELFEKIVIPETVYKEITSKEHDKLIFDKLEWIETRSVRNEERERKKQPPFPRSIFKSLTVSKFT